MNSFRYTNFEILADSKTVSFNYAIAQNGEIYDLHETVEFPFSVNEPRFGAALRSLHLALGISYYKIFVSPTIEQPYQMDSVEAGFWNDVFKNGLGEFCYVNDLNPNNLGKFLTQDGVAFELSQNGDGHSALLGIGGGKDSVVAGELLKNIGIKTTGFVMATGSQLGQAGEVAKIMGIDLLAVRRQLDKKLLDLQEKPGAFRGHVPISLVFGLVGTILAIGTGSKYVVVANEASASIPRTSGNFGPVNHQWSKSLEFEKQFQQFIKQNINSSLTYFSAVRQLSSVAIAKLFAKLPQYFEVFTSDNSVFRIDPKKRPNSRWSLESPKSLSSFMLLAPWIGETDMLRIFGRNFLDEPRLEKLFLELVGVQGEPPLDCVGTTEELVLSLNLAVAQGKFAGSQLVDLVRQHGVIQHRDWPAQLSDMLKLGPDQSLPTELKPAIEAFFSEELAR